MTFPIDLSAYRPVTLDPKATRVAEADLKQLRQNIQLGRDAIVFFTGLAQARGLGGHTGGAYDITPELLIADAFMRGSQGQIIPEYFDEAGHRVAIQYLMSVFNGHMAAEKLLHYREVGFRLPGHPERDFTPGVTFSSGRLGHMWPYLNGVAARHPDKCVVMFGSDGSQQEGNSAEAARFAVGQDLNIKVIIDDNDVTIAGHPSQYLKGYNLKNTLSGHGLAVDEVDGEDLPALIEKVRKLLTGKGPAALLAKRKMAPGIRGLEGTPHGHDAIAVPLAIEYLSERGHSKAVEMLKSATKVAKAGHVKGSSEERASVRGTFGQALVEILQSQSPEERKKTLVVDSDLEGSCGLNHVRKGCPEVYVSGGIMERGNYSAAAGFGREPGYQGVFATFSAFLEMLVSEITMARLNESNVLAHFSHAGVAEIVDNTCHFGINNFYADGGLGPDDNTRLYFPADQHQMRAVVKRVFGDAGLRFVFSARCALPDILTADGKPVYGGNYEFEPGVDEVVREGAAGWVVSYGDVLHQALGAVEQLRAEGVDVGLLNKTTLNVVDEKAMAKIGKSGFVFVAESQNATTGLGSRMGSWLLERGYRPKLGRAGTTERGMGGSTEQIVQQKLDAPHLVEAIRKLV